MRRRAIAAMVATVGVFAGLVTGSASAAPAWLPPSLLSPSGGGTFGNVVLAADAKGEAVSVWWSEGVGIEGAFRPAESPSWAAPATVSTPGQHAENPQVGIDAKGDAVAVWQGGPEEKVEAAVRPASSGLWEAPVAISPEGGGWLRPQVAVDARGDAVAVWSYPYPEGSPSAVVNDTIQAAERPAGGSGWEPAVWVSPFGKAPYEQRFSLAPQIAIDSEGEAVAVWEDQAESASVFHKFIEAAVKPPNSATWGSPVVLAEMGRQPQVAMDASGDAVAVWPGPGGLYSATLPASSSTWQPSASVSTNEAENQHVAIDSLGDAVVAWESIGAATNTVQAAVKAKGDAAWGASASLSEPVEYAGGYPRLNPSVAIDAKGSAAATWNGFHSQTDETVQVAVLPAIGSSWQAPLQLADVGGSFVIPVVGMDEKGNGEAVWAHGSGANAAVEAANYDGSSPALEGASIPTTGQTARPLAFTVSPLAVTTALGQTSWSFGDGPQPTVGTSVSHAFTAPGSYHVTVTTADVLGNTTSATSTVVVTNASPRPRCRCMRYHLILSKVGITNKRFRVTSSQASRRGQHRPALPFGTTFRFALSERATVRIEITRVGVRDCKKATNRCTHSPVGALTYAGERAGNDAAVFHGRVGKNVLRAGRYIASITARSRFGSSKMAQVRFVIAQ